MIDQEPDEARVLLAPTQSLLSRPTTIPNVLHTILSATAVLIALTIGSQIAVASQLSILEDLVCQKYYDSAGTDDHPGLSNRCKIEPVQSEMAFINGWKDVLEILPAILLAVPYGALADRIGRKKVLMLAISGCFLVDVWVRVVYWFPTVFPLRAVWLSGLWQVFGAGAVTMSSIAFVLVADVCPPERRITAFSQMHCATLLSELLFIPIGASLMSMSPWIPMFTASTFTLLGLLIVVVFVPETLPPADIEAITERRVQSRGRVVHWFQRRTACLVSVGKWIVRNAKVALALLAFFFFHLGGTSNGSLLLQYTSRRLSWSLAQASYLLSIRAGISILVLTVLFPASHHLLQRLHLHTMAKDKIMAQLSGALLSIGAGVIFVGISPAPLVAGQILISLGWSFSIPARSLITSMVNTDELATVYTIISVMTYAGTLAGTPILVGFFQWGMKFGGYWVGMPFLVAGVSFALATMAISITTHRREDMLED